MTIAIDSEGDIRRSLAVFSKKLLLTLVIICKLCFAAAPLVFLFQPVGDLFQTDAAIQQLSAPAEPQPGGLRRLFGHRLLGQ